MHDLVHNSIQDCDPDIQKDLYENIILCGGSSLFTGLPERLEQEVDKKCPEKGSTKIITSSHRPYSAFVGGSKLSNLSSFESQWITKDEYEENGAEIVHRKCV